MRSREVCRQTWSEGCVRCLQRKPPTASRVDTLRGTQSPASVSPQFPRTPLHSQHRRHDIIHVRMISRQQPVVVPQPEALLLILASSSVVSAGICVARNSTASYPHSFASRMKSGTSISQWRYSTSISLPDRDSFIRSASLSELVSNAHRHKHAMTVDGVKDALCQT